MQRKGQSLANTIYTIYFVGLYILRGEIQAERMLPDDFPRWQLVHYYFMGWSKSDAEGNSLLKKLLKKIGKKVRADKSKNEKTSFGIIDSKSIKNTDTAEGKGYDAGKKVSGIKLHIIVDALGLLHAIHVTCANVTDRKGALDMNSLHLENLSSVSKFLVDGGYFGDNFADSVEEIHGADAQVAKKNEFHKFCVLPKRWIVERTFGWLEKNRRLWKNCERKLHSSL